MQVLDIERMYMAGQITGASGESVVNHEKNIVSERGRECAHDLTYPSMVRIMFRQRSPPQPETVKTPKGGTVAVKKEQGRTR